MNNISLNIAGKIDPQTVAIFEIVSRATSELQIPFVVVGATARDIVMHYGHGAPIERATSDVDFAIEVPSWEAFNALKDLLSESGFRSTSAQQRLIDDSGNKIDIVPFGKVESKKATVTWPPDDAITMNVLGFKEACDSAEWVRVNENPQVDIPVVTPTGLMLLKLIAWTDRGPAKRVRDALDIAYLLSTYERIKVVEDRLYDEDYTGVMDSYDWDITLGELTLERMVEEMCEHIDLQYEKNAKAIAAFFKGFGIAVDLQL